MAVLLAIDPSTKETGWAIFTGKPESEDGEPGQDECIPTEASLAHRGESCQPHGSWELVETGVIIPHQRPWRVEVATRIKAIEVELDSMAERWRPRDVACGKPSLTPLQHQKEWVEIFSRALERWAQGLKLTLHSYPLREIRATLSGRANAAKDELAYAVMTRWGLLGMRMTTHELNAIAVGDYHLGLKSMPARIESQAPPRQ